MQLCYRWPIHAASSTRIFLTLKSPLQPRSRCLSSGSNSTQTKEGNQENVDDKSHIPTKSETTDFERTWSAIKGRQLDEEDLLINPHSLEETLEAHRRANREKIIVRRIKHNVPQSLSAVAQKATTTPSVKKTHKAKHLILERRPPLPKAPRETEYEGESRPLMTTWMFRPDLPRYLRYPWVQGLDSTGTSQASAQTRLTDEIRSADAYLTPTKDEQKVIDSAIREIQDIVRKNCSEITQVDVIGSRASGLADTLSDIDLNLRIDGQSAEATRLQSVEILGRVYRKLRYDRAIQPTLAVRFFALKARVPIISGSHIATGLEFQMQQTHISSGSLEFTKLLSAEFPTLRALFKVLKQMLKMRGLMNGVRGGLTSYPLLNMIVASLKIHESQTNPFDPGRQLLQFLDLFCEMDFYTTGIAHRPSKFMHRKLSTPNTNIDDWFDLSEAVSQDPIAAMPVLFDVRKNYGDLYKGRTKFMMTLLDPANPYNDLGHNAYSIKHIQATLLSIRTELKSSMAAWDEKVGHDGMSEEKPRPLLSALLGADYSLYIRERKSLVSNSETKKMSLDSISSKANHEDKRDSSVLTE